MKWLRRIIWGSVATYGLIGVVASGFTLVFRLGLDLNLGMPVGTVLAFAMMVALLGFVPLLLVIVLISVVDLILSILGSPQKIVGSWKLYLVGGLLATIAASASLINDIVGLIYVLGALLTITGVALHSISKPDTSKVLEGQESYWYENGLLLLIMLGIVPLLFGLYARNLLTSIWGVSIITVTSLVAMLKSGQSSRFRVVMIGFILVYATWINLDRLVLRMSWEQVSTCEEYPLYLSVGTLGGYWLESVYLWYTPTAVPGVFRYEGSSLDRNSQQYVVKQFGDQYQECLDRDKLPSPSML